MKARSCWSLGGSKGARSINTAVLANLPALVEMAQVIHITGELDWPNVEAKERLFKMTYPEHSHIQPATTPSRTCTSRWAPPWLRPTWRSAGPELPRWANIRSSACRQYWCPTRMPGVTRKSMPIISSGMLRQSARRRKTIQISSCRPYKIYSISLRNWPPCVVAMQQLSHPEAAAQIGRQLLALGPDEEMRP